MSVVTGVTETDGSQVQTGSAGRKGHRHGRVTGVTGHRDGRRHRGGGQGIRDGMPTKDEIEHGTPRQPSGTCTRC